MIWKGPPKAALFFCPDFTASPRDLPKSAASPPQTRRLQRQTGESCAGKHIGLYENETGFGAGALTLADGRKGRPMGGIRAEHGQRNGADSLAPQLAGARARGVADALSLLGLPAIFLDQEGRALHVSREAALLMGPTLGVDRARLVAADSATDELLQALIDRGLEGRNCAPVKIRPAGESPEGDSLIIVHALPIPGAFDDEFQLLGCILVLERANKTPDFALVRAAMARIAASAADIYPAH